MTRYLDRTADLDDSRIASVFDEASLWSARFGQLLLENLALQRGIVGLDLGCGAGFPLFELAHMHGPDSRFVGVDIGHAPLLRAALKREIHDRTGIHLVRADAAALPFADETFHLIVSNVGVNNFASPPHALRECARVLRRGGRLALTTNPIGHMRELYAEYLAVLEELRMAAAVPRLEANERHRLSEETLRGWIEASGMRVSRVVRRSFTMRTLDARAFFTHSLIRFGFLDGWRAVVEPADERRVFAALEQRLDALAARDGELRMTVPMLSIEARRS